MHEIRSDAVARWNAGITAAHNCTMKAVAVQSPFKAYELKAADLTCASLAELSVYNVRRLFANVGAEFMDLMQQKNSQQTPRRRGTTTT